MALPRWMVRDRPEVPAEEAPGAEPQLRRERRTDRIRPWLIVVLIAAVGFALVLEQYWRRGVVLVGVAFAVAALLRLVLPNSLAGILAVRFRSFDVAVYGGLSAAVLIGAFAVPPPGTGG